MINLQNFGMVKNLNTSKITNFQAIDLPVALEENLIELAPKSKSELKLERPFSLRQNTT